MPQGKSPPQRWYWMARARLRSDIALRVPRYAPHGTTYKGIVGLSKRLGYKEVTRVELLMFSYGAHHSRLALCMSSTEMRFSTFQRLFFCRHVYVSVSFVLFFCFLYIGLIIT